MWLVNQNNPLTARVCVNRYWQMIFGVGLVKTAEDFGIQGEAPSHPELLDWMAVEFMESGWDVKHILKLIVLSSTYRQSSHAPAALWQRDPENRLLARGPRIRLPAELVRDQALAASGLMVDVIGGPSVKPYQPEGLWKEIATDVDYGQEHGANLYRRSLYTYWKRTVAPPTMVTFDAFSRETCMLRRSRTNTPLQALASMNDPTFVEAARKLAERSLHESGPSAEERVSYMFLLTAARRPNGSEAEILVRSLHRNLTRFQADESSAISLLAVGESPRDETIPRAELAAYTVVASLILNSDEALTKE